MILSDDNIKIWYTEYLKQYERTKKYVKSHGGKVRDIAPSSLRDFKIDFITASYESKRGGFEIAKKMAKEELYQDSWKRSTALSKAHVKLYGGTLNLNLIQSYRMNAVRGKNVLDEIRSRREQLKRNNEDININLIISQEFFGSP